MELLNTIFGEGKDLNLLQMCSRGAVVFFLAWILIRISGRRSFGLKRALDNIIVVLLGSILSRAVAGASPFVPTIGACLLIVILHRASAMLSIYNKSFSDFANGKKTLVYKNGVFYKKNMDKSLVRQEDLEEQVRLRANMDSLEEIESIYMEKNGELSAVKKKKE